MDYSRFSLDELYAIRDALEKGDLTSLGLPMLGKIRRAMTGEPEPGLLGNLGARAKIGWNRLEQGVNVGANRLGALSDEATAAYLAANERDIAEASTRISPEVEAVREGLRDKSYGEIGGEILSHPGKTLRTAAAIGAESLAQFAPGLAAAGIASLAPGIGPAAAGAIGAAAIGGTSFGIETTSRVLDAMAKEGVDVRDKAQVIEFLGDEEKVNRALKEGALRGIPIAALDAVSFGIAGMPYRALSGLFAKAGSAAGKKALAARLAGATVGSTGEIATQMATGAAGEYLGQQVLGEHDPAAVVEEALGELGPGVVESVTRIAGSARRTARETDRERKIREELEKRGAAQAAAGRRSLRELGVVDYEAGQLAEPTPSPQQAAAEARRPEIADRSGIVAPRPEEYRAGERPPQQPAAGRVPTRVALSRLSEDARRQVLESRRRRKVASPGKALSIGEAREIFGPKFADELFRTARPVGEKAAIETELTTRAPRPPMPDEVDYQRAEQIIREQGADIRAIRKAVEEKYQDRKAVDEVTQGLLRSLILRGLLRSRSGEAERAAREGRRIKVDPNDLRPTEMPQEPLPEGTRRQFVLRPMVSEQRRTGGRQTWAYTLGDGVSSQLFATRKEAEAAAREAAARRGVEEKPRVFRAAPRLAVVEQAYDQSGELVGEAVRENYEPRPDVSPPDTSLAFASLEEARRAALPYAPDVAAAVPEVGEEQARKVQVWQGRNWPGWQALQASLKKMGLAEDVALRLQNVLMDPTGAFVEGSEVRRSDGRILIKIATDLSGLEGKAQVQYLRGVLNHEIIHALRDLGLFKPKEWRTLVQAAAKRKSKRGGTFRERAEQQYKGEPPEVIEEESVAEMFREWADRPSTVSGAPASLLRRIVNFLKRLGDWLTGNNIRASEDIMRAIQEGEIGRRPRRPTARAEPEKFSRVGGWRAPFYSPLRRAVEINNAMHESAAKSMPMFSRLPQRVLENDITRDAIIETLLAAPLARDVRPIAEQLVRYARSGLRTPLPERISLPRPKSRHFDAWFGDSVVTRGYLERVRSILSPNVRYVGNQPNADDPLVLWHFTDASEDFAVFRPLSHFGTFEAARQRGMMRGTYGSDEEALGQRLGDLIHRAANRAGVQVAQPALPIAGGESWILDPAAWEWWESLTDDQKADALAEELAELIRGARMIPVHLAIEKPLIAEDPGISHDSLDAWLRLAGPGSLAERIGQRVLTEEQVRSLREEGGGPENVAHMLSMLGYDGVVYVNEVEDRGSISWVPFSSTQVASIFRDWSNPEEVHTEKFSRVTMPEPASWEEERVSEESYALAGVAPPEEIHATMDRLIGEHDTPTVWQSVRDGMRHWSHRFFGMVPGETWRQALKRNLISRFDRAYDMDRDLLRARGMDENIANLGPHSLGRLLEMSMNMAGRISHLMDYGTFRYDRQRELFVPKEGSKSLWEIFRPIGRKNQRFFHSYWIAKNELEMRAAGRPSFSDVSDEELRAIIRSAPPEFEEVLNDYKKFNADILQIAVDAGILTPDQRDRFLQFSHVPYYRVFEDDMVSHPGEIIGPGVGAMMNNPKSALDIRREGGDLIVGDMYENMIRNIESILSASLRNMALQQAAKHIDELRSAGLNYGHRITSKEESKRAKYKMGLRIDGHRVEYAIEDPAFWAALTALPPQQAQIVKDIGLRFSALLRDGITLNPAFMLANLWRGKISAFVISNAPFNPTATMKGLMAALKNDIDAQIIKLNTGMGGYAYGQAVPDYATALKAKLGKGDTERALAKRFKDSVRVLIENWQAVGEATELAERIALYRRLRQQGMGERAAAFEAMNLINFNRRGAGDGWLAQGFMWLIPLVPFLNARVQGLYRLVENQQGRKRIVGLPSDVFGRGLLVTGASMVAYALASSDDRWDRETTESKINYDIFYLGDKTIRIPRAFEVGSIFATMPILFMDLIRERDGDRFAEAVLSVFMNTFSFNPIPQAVRPLIEVSTGKDFFTGVPITGTFDSTLLPSRRFDQNTSEFAKILGGFTGDSDVLAALGLNLSPKEWDHLIVGYMGSLAQNILATTDAIVAGAGLAPQKPAGIFGDPFSPTAIAASIAGMKRFVRESWDTPDQYIREFYDLKIRAVQIERSINDAIENGDIEWAKRALEENRAPVAMRKMLDKVGRTISKINRQIRSTLMNPKLSAAQKREALRRLRETKSRLAAQAVRMAQAHGL